MVSLQEYKENVEVNIMNKVELIAAVAAKAGLSKKDAEKAIAAVVESIEETLV